MSVFNCTEPFSVPEMYAMYEGLTDTQIILFVIAGAFNAAVLIIGIVHSFTIWKYINDEKIRSKLYVLALLFPIVVSLAFCSMFSPRSGPILSSIGVLYILLSMYTITSLCRCVYGDREKLSSELTASESVITFQVPPCCCCMFCLPKAGPSERNLKIVECLTLQGPIVRAIIVIINCHFVAEKRENSIHLLQITELAGILSLLFTIFGAHTMMKLVGKYTQKYRIMTIFRFVDITLAVFTAQQPLIFELLLVNLGIIGCSPLLSAIDNAKYICNFTIICEALLFSVLATRALLPEKCALFDKYPHHLREVPQNVPTQKALLTE